MIDINRSADLARMAEDFRPLTDAERRAMGIDGDDPVHVWGMGDHFTAMNAPTLRRDRASEARPYIMGFFVALGVLIGLGMAMAAQAAALGGM